MTDVNRSGINCSRKVTMIQTAVIKVMYLYYVLRKFSWPKIELVKAKSNTNKNLVL